MLKLIEKYLQGTRPANLYVAGIVAILCCGAVDYLSGSRFSFSLFYTIPLALAAWYGGRAGAVLLVIMASITWYIADKTSRNVNFPSALLFWNTFMRFAYFMIIVLLVAKVKRLLEVEEMLADTDVLTGLPNRRSFQEKAVVELERCRRYKHPFTLAYIDLDNFKIVNDSHGHDEGDKLLVSTAEILNKNLRATDLCSRLGGDEFAVMLSNTGKKESSAALKKIHKLFHQEMENSNWPVTLSIGAVTYKEPMRDLRDMIKLSDDLMYHVKKKGKNKITHITWPVSGKLPRSLLEMDFTDILAGESLRS